MIKFISGVMLGAGIALVCVTQQPALCQKVVLNTLKEHEGFKAQIAMYSQPEDFLETLTKGR